MDFEKAIKLAVVFFLTAIALTFYGPARGQILSEPSDAQLAEMRTTVLPIATAEGERFCSAVVLYPGVAATAAHCVSPDAPPGSIEQNGKLLPIAGVKIEPGTDLAGITVPGLECPCAALAPRANYEIGMPVAAVGYPGGGVNTLTVGYYIGRLQVFDDGVEMNALLATAPVRPGNSGGGLFMWDGTRFVLIGITSATLSDGRASFYSEIWQSP